MFFVFLDEFGHIGPFISRKDPSHNTSPVFGVGGIILPEQAVRKFSSAFLQLKSAFFDDEISNSRKIAQIWEKKGTDIFKPRPLEKYTERRRLGFRLINQVTAFGGSVFYHGREKTIGKLDGNSVGLYTTIFGYTIRKLNSHFRNLNENFIIVLDQHSSRKELLVCASKTIYGRNPAKRMLCPPFEVESHVNQPIQAADWICAILGRLWAHELQAHQYEDHEKTRNYYWDRIHDASISSSNVTLRRTIDNLMPLPQPPSVELPPSTSLEIALKAAGFGVIKR